MKNELFTIILLYYKQPKLIYEALDSVLKQDYKNIELIITDDGSALNTTKIKKYIDKNNSGNITNLRFVINEKNIGTVKTSNKALRIAKGSYILIFAADDALYSKTVISNFVSNFKNNSNDFILTAQAIMYNQTLTKSYGKYVNVKKAYHNNYLSAKNQYLAMCDNCIYGAGATAYRKEVFENLNYFNEDYFLVEDWSFWLRATRCGYKIKFINFIALKHRDGGVSKSENQHRKKSMTVCRYYYDLALINVNEILPYLNHFHIIRNINVLKKYNSIIYFLNCNVKDMVTSKIYSRKLYYQIPEYFIYKVLIKIKALVLKILRKIKRLLIISLKLIKKIIKGILKNSIWLLLNFIVLAIKDNYLKIFIIILNFYLSLLIKYYLLAIVFNKKVEVLYEK